MNSDSDLSSSSSNCEEEETSSERNFNTHGSIEFKENKVESEILRKIIKTLKVGCTELYFAQGKVNSNDVFLKIDGFENITFPIKYKTATKLLDIARLASFGHGEQTKQDQNVRDTYLIPKEKLNVIIKNLDDILKDIKIKLSLNENSNLEAHLHNMLIYKQGQHFDYHQDTEKMDNMVATLVIVLPSAHVGGDLIVKHLNQSHVFSSEMIYSKCVKYIAFYSDCQHKVERVKEGFRIVLTYNLVLGGSKFLPNISCDEKLITGLKKYFKNGEEEYDTKKLIYLLDHCYTKKGIKFANLKGLDLRAASALLCAAKKLNLVVRLVLADIREVWDGEAGDLIDMDITLKSWQDENDQLLEFEPYEASQSDVCWLKNNNSFDPYEVENSGYTGNEGITEERWYKRAAIVLWPQSSDLAMQFELNFRGELNKLKTLIESPSNKKSIQDVLEKVGENLFVGLNSSRNSKEIVETFTKLAISVDNPVKAIEICLHIYNDLFDRENSNFLFELKNVYGSSWCLQLIDKKGIYRNVYSDELIKFLLVLKDYDRTTLEQILRHQIANAGRGCDKNEHFHRYGTLVRAVHETKIFNYLKDIFEAVLSKEWDIQKLAQFYVQHCTNIPQDMVKTLKESVVKSLQMHISRYRETHDKQLRWLSKVNLGSCKCELCKVMNSFLKSKNYEKEFAVNKEKREHLLKFFEVQNKGTLVMTIKCVGSPYRLVVRKKFDSIKNWEDELAELERQFKIIIETDAGEDKPLKSESVKHSSQPENIKTSVKKQCI